MSVHDAHEHLAHSVPEIIIIDGTESVKGFAVFFRRFVPRDLYRTLYARSRLHSRRRREHEFFAKSFRREKKRDPSAEAVPDDSEPTQAENFYRLFHARGIVVNAEIARHDGREREAHARSSPCRRIARRRRERRYVAAPAVQEQHRRIAADASLALEFDTARRKFQKQSPRKKYLCYMDLLIIRAFFVL